MKNLMYPIIFLISFFPAYLGYQPQYAWVGFLCTIGFALACYIPFLRDSKWAGWKALVVLSIFGYVIESIGVVTCFPYGCFAYSEQLGVKILGIVPWLLAFTRPPLVIGVWSILKNYGRDPSTSFRFTAFRSGGRLVLSGGLSLVIFDLILDPIAVAMGLRSYPGGGWWFGVPWTNFAGWMWSGTIGVAIVDYFLRDQKIQKIYHHGLLCFLVFFVGWPCGKIIFTFL